MFGKGKFKGSKLDKKVLIVLVFCLVLAFSVSSPTVRGKSYYVNDFSPNVDNDIRFYPSPNAQLMGGYAEAWFSFDFNQSSGVVDLSQNLSDGTMNGGMDTGNYLASGWDSEIGGSSLSFDGSDDYVSIDSGAVDGTNNGGVSFSAWIKGDSWSGLTYITSYDGVSSSWRVRVNDSGNVEMTYSSSGNNPQLSSTTSLNTGEWYHIIADYDHETGECSLWVNGTEEDTNSSGGDLDGSTGATSIGSHIDTDHFDGQIDEFMMFDGSLSPSEIYNKYAQRREPTVLDSKDLVDNVVWESDVWSLSENHQVDNIEWGSSYALDSSLFVSVSSLDSSGNVVDNTGWKEFTSFNFWNIKDDLDKDIEGNRFKTYFKLDDRAINDDDHLTLESFTLNASSNVGSAVVDDISITDQYVDDSIDWANDQANSSTTAEITISGFSGLETLEIEWIDNSGTIQETTTAVKDYEVDSNTAVYTSSYSPSSLESYRKGGFDVRAIATDTQGATDTDQENNLFFVDDFNNVSVQAEYDNSSGEVIVSGSARTEIIGLYPTTVYVDDPSGTYTASISGDNFNKSFSVPEDFGEAEITVRILNSNGIDGMANTSYSTTGEDDEEIGDIGGFSVIILVVLGLPILLIIFWVASKALGGKK